MRRAVALAVVAVVLLVVAVALPRYDCAEGFALFDIGELVGADVPDDVVCVPDTGAYATAGEVSDRGAIKVATAIAGMIFGAVAVFELVRARRRDPYMGTPDARG